MQVAVHKHQRRELRSSGQFIDLEGERYYAIHNVDRIEPFLISVISSVDHWLFVSSTGGLTAGRVSPATALFPYITVDKIHDSLPHTGPLTVVRVRQNSQLLFWEPFNRAHVGPFTLSRHIYKSLLGDKLCFEEINHDLNLAFRYTWKTCDRYGFVRNCELRNLGNNDIQVEILDGLQNVLPAGTPMFAQTNTSNLVDAYKWSELDEQSNLAIFALYSKITDRAEPGESLRANTVFSLGLENPQVLISSTQLRDYYAGANVSQETRKRGVRGAYLVSAVLPIAAGDAQRWQIVANIEQSQSAVVALQQEIENPAAVSAEIQRCIDADTDSLARIMARGDAYQAIAEENVSVHHYANVLFNILRGGVFDDQYRIGSKDFRKNIRTFNKPVYSKHKKFLHALPERIDAQDLLTQVTEQQDPQLERLAYEYLPITFGRRHGDPSRPWNQFVINVKDENGEPNLAYQGNWRDIFQNWEALLWSYPGYVENVVAKFVNASTMDGYNPYRITEAGIDWEVEEPDDPWSYIGYWGDHQIIYLLKLLELSQAFHPSRMQDLLRRRIFCFANVPYRIVDFEALLRDPKNTVHYDEGLAEQIEQRVQQIGADGKLVLADDGDVYLVNLLEKLLIPLLGKLANLVVDGGIWMNTQRPEWNDANNALVGQGLSMVTLCYLRRYVAFLQDLLAADSGDFELSAEVSEWLTATSAALARLRQILDNGPVSDTERFQALAELGEAAGHYRLSVYERGNLSGHVECSIDSVRDMLRDTLQIIDRSIASNRREDGLFHAYNLLELADESLSVDSLYPMLEGQVAALSAGSVPAEQAVAAVEALFASEVYRPGQNSFMLYPDRPLQDFLQKNRIPPDQADSIPLLGRMLADGDHRIVVRDDAGNIRFNADFTNAGDLKTRIDELLPEFGDELKTARKPLLRVYEAVFQHKEFTGRSGTMFGFEGLGSIYWHMVSKLLLAVQENFFTAFDLSPEAATTQRLGELYYDVREGIGFNKTPAEFGAFPMDPYSHTPKHAGARQPGMTGQVKEEVITRFGELGVRVKDGSARFQPALLREQEFVAEDRETGYLDVNNEWQTIAVPARSVAYTWCQVPVLYRLADSEEVSLCIEFGDGTNTRLPRLELPAAESAELFRRSGKIKQLTLTIHSEMLFKDS